MQRGSMPASTFISFSSKDQQIVDLLAHILRFHGIRTWISSSSLTGGEQWPREISEALRAPRLDVFEGGVVLEARTAQPIG